MSLSDYLATNREEFRIRLQTSRSREDADGSFLDEVPPPGLTLDPGAWDEFCRDVYTANIKLSRHVNADNLCLCCLMAVFLLLDNIVHYQWILALIFVGICLLFTIRWHRHYAIYTAELKSSVERLRRVPGMQWRVKVMTARYLWCFSIYYAQFRPKSWV